MVDIDDFAEDAARGVIDAANQVEPPDMTDVRSARRRRSGFVAAAGAFAVTLVVVGAATLTGGTAPGSPDVAGPPPATADDSPPQDATTVETRPGLLATIVVENVSVGWPAGWAQADETLTPSRVDPLELFSIATFPLSAESGVCGPFPWQAVVDFPTDGGFVTLRERFSGADFPARPAALGGANPYVLPEGDCLDNTNRGDIGTMHFLEFEEAGRFFELLIVVGATASETTTLDVWDIANTISVEGVDQPAPLTTDTVFGGNVFILDDGNGPEACGAVMESLPPQCGGPKVVGLDWNDISWAESAQGVRWATAYIEFRVADGEFVLVATPTDPQNVATDQPNFPTPPEGIDTARIRDDLGTLTPNDWPSGIVGAVSWWANEAEGWVEMEAMIVTDEGRRWLDDRYGVGAVRATSLLLPVDDIVVTEPAPAMPAAPSLPGEPDAVRAREALFYCGAAFGTGVTDADAAEFGVVASEAAIECFRDRLDEELASEITVVDRTIEGDFIVSIYRGWVDGKFEVFVDSTRDAFGTQEWVMYTCDQIEFDPPRVRGCTDALSVKSP